MTKISQLPSVGDSLAIDDQFVIRDVSDASNPNKSITVSGITRGLADGNELAPALAFAADKNTGIYRPGADQLAISTNGTGRLFVDSNGKVGVGTANPAGPFHIVGSGATSVIIDRTDDAPGVAFRFNGSTNAQILTGTDGSISINSDPTNALASSYIRAMVDSSERLRITSDGKIGIGTTSPNRILEVSGATVDNFIRVNTTGATKSGIEFASGGTVYSQLYFNNVSPYDLLLLQQYSTGSVILGTNNTERARIDSSGRLLVGTSSSPSAGDGQYSNFVVEGYVGDGAGSGEMSLQRGQAATAMSDNNQLGGINFTDNAGNTFAHIRANVDGTPGSGDYPGRLVFSTNAGSPASSPTERMRISSGGQISQFCDTGWDGVRVGSATGAGTVRRLFSGYYSATAVNTGTESFRVYTNGNVQNTNNSYGAISDIKLKENIVDASSQWDDLKAIQVRNYNFKEGQTHTQLGVVAQEVELVSPGLVSESSDRDEEGNDLGTVTKSVNYSVLYMKAVKALQEAMERIEVLEQRLTDAGIA